MLTNGRNCTLEVKQSLHWTWPTEWNVDKQSSDLKIVEYAFLHRFREIDVSSFSDGDENESRKQANCEQHSEYNGPKVHAAVTGTLFTLVESGATKVWTTRVAQS